VNFPIQLGYYEETGQPRYYCGDGNIAIVAGARMGKQRDFLTPICLQYPGSMVVADPRGELAAISAAQRARMGQRVILVTAFRTMPDVLGPKAERFRGLEDRIIFDAGYNPMRTLNKDTDEYGADCDALAGSIVTPADNVRESHWYDSAEEQLSGTIMALNSLYPPDAQNYAELRKLVAAKDEVFAEFAADACGRDEEDGLVTDRLERFTVTDAKNAGEISSILSTARTQTRFISNKAIANSLRRSDFRFADLRKKPTTVYLILPLKRLKRIAAWWKVLLVSAFEELLTEPDGSDWLPVLMIIDELAQMPVMPFIREVLACSAGSKLQIMPVVQNLDQLKPYGGHETFIANCDVSVFMPRNLGDAQYLSALCGTREIIVPSESQKEVSEREAMEGMTGMSVSFGRDKQPLIEPHEILQLPSDRFLLFSDGRVRRGLRRSYLDVPELARLASPNPYHQSKGRAV
jgi:type IV secretion system protein VirD4